MRETAVECREMVERWLLLLPQCVRGLKEPHLNDSHEVNDEYGNIATWAHRHAIAACKTNHSELGIRSRTTSQNSLVLHEDMDLHKKVG